MAEEKKKKKYSNPGDGSVNAVSAVAPHTNVMAILSIIFAFVFGPLGIIFGIIALSQIKKDPSATGKKLALAGIIIPIIGIIIAAILAALGFFISQ